ncbi:3-oxoacyl-[acyl-carrier-protein] synthase III C-terminal domain-containing protein [uncultured Cohaesibacter sp.]|uniref:hydroxymethylglutaryl-CoA synthase family protein n=1 Tax=uncultured Cohaesibacter sp. TaxID=1002546 RepID=UPI00292EB67C|nr:3-oxoacyl-[acyl-carrier-protein] synthase III C-terminal domain-containing protein [uncultured Cohaesibacter sp.]
MKIGIKSFGVYVPNYYLSRETIGLAWEAKGSKGKKSIANVDEDTLTMAVEAAMDCFRFVSREEISSLYFASTTAPYAEKAHSALISVACDLENNSVFTSDFANSTRAGTSALLAACDAVKADEAKNSLVVASDMRKSYPKSPEEMTLGDAAAAMVVGTGDVFATIDGTFSFNDEIVDIWRNAGDQYISVGESRFVVDEGYLRVMKAAVAGILEKYSLEPKHIAKVVFSGANARNVAKLAKKCGFSADQIQDTLLNSVGDSGTAQAFLGIVSALEAAEPGEKILLADYGSGANTFILTATENVRKVHRADTLKRFLENRKEFGSYARYLSFREIAPAKPGSPFKLPASSSMTWREQKLNLRLHGSRCTECGAAIFPINRVCHKCGAVDKFEEFRASDLVTKIFTFSVDQYAGRSDDPVLVQTVTEGENGERYYTIMTDFNVEDVRIGMEMEFTFRKMHALGNFPNYYWKVRPLRREKRTKL